MLPLTSLHPFLKKYPFSDSYLVSYREFDDIIGTKSLNDQVPPECGPENVALSWSSYSPH